MCTCRGSDAVGCPTPGDWAVRARVERLVEPALLLLLHERPRHGYDLLENIPALIGDSAEVDLGNYRLLRGLEAEGLVRRSGTSMFRAGTADYTLTRWCSAAGSVGKALRSPRPWTGHSSIASTKNNRTP